MTRDAWDQLDGESAESYSRFLRYRNLGSLRSIKKAYFVYLQAEDGFQGRIDRLHVPGHWTHDAAKNRWVDRASAWDIHILVTYGAQVACLHAQVIAKLARKNASKVGKLNPGDKGFSDLLASIRTVAEFLSPELVKGVQDRYKSAEPALASVGADDPDE